MACRSAFLLCDRQSLSTSCYGNNHTKIFTACLNLAISILLYFQDSEDSNFSLIGGFALGMCVGCLQSAENVFQRSIFDSKMPQFYRSVYFLGGALIASFSTSFGIVLALISCACVLISNDSPEYLARRGNTDQSFQEAKQIYKGDDQKLAAVTAQIFNTELNPSFNVSSFMQVSFETVFKRSTHTVLLYTTSLLLIKSVGDHLVTMGGIIVYSLFFQIHLALSQDLDKRKAWKVHWVVNLGYILLALFSGDYSFLISFA